MQRKRVLVLLVSTLVILGLLASFLACAAPTASPTSSPTPTLTPAAATTPTPTELPKPTLTPTPAPKMVLKFASPHPEKAFVSQQLYKYYLDKVTELSGARITFETYWASSLVSQPEMLKSIQDRVVDLGVGIWAFEPTRAPLGNYEFNFPFNLPDVTFESKIKREMYETIPALREEMARFNITTVVFCALNSYDILSKTPIRTLVDLKGKNVGHTPVEYARYMAAVGANSVISGAPDFYERLDRGVVDTIFLPLEVQDTYKLYEVAKYHTSLNFNIPVQFGVWMNTDLLESLTDQDRQIFIEAGKFTEEAYHPKLIAQTERIRQTFMEKGVEFITLPEEDVNRWFQAITDVTADWINKMEAAGQPGRHVADTYIELQKKYGWEYLSSTK